MDTGAYALASVLAILCFLSFVLWLLWSIFNRILRAFARTTARTIACIQGLILTKR